MHDEGHLDHLVIRFLRGELSPEEEAELERWRQADPANDARATETERLWGLTGAALSREIETVPPDVGRLVAAGSEPFDGGSRTADRSDSGSVPPRRWRFAGATIAAAALAVLAFGVGSVVERQRMEGTVLEATEVTTGAGELTTVTLTDGTAVRVGPRSRLQVFRQGNVRVVELDRRAFFSVAPDEVRRFIVRTRFGDATALGTRFEVRTERREFRVLVVEGSVRVSAEGSDVDMEAGMMSRSTEGEATTTTRVDDPEDLLAWMGRTLMFRSTPLADVIEEIEGQYEVEVELEDPRLLELSVSATFTDQELESVVSIVCGIIGADCSVDDDSVRIDSLRTA